MVSRVTVRATPGAAPGMGKKNHKPKARQERRASVPPSSTRPARPSTRPPAPVDTLLVPPPPPTPARRAGARGSAPWAARHAERHAREAAARLRDPPRPGSARATLRTPDQADRIKARIGELHAALGRVRTLRKNLGEHFWELAQVLHHIAEERLFDAKGYATFEAFVEREIDISRSVALRLARVPDVFQERAAKRFGLDPLLAALDSLESAAQPAPKKSSPRAALPLKPPR
jgi:hypothetical protein